jgi:molybdopterin-containing oxidoreductase family iron-sulfur binding subunit
MAIAIARGLGADLPKPDLPREAAAFGDEIARDVAAHRGRALVIPGAALPADIHALCHWINAQVQAPIDYFEARQQLTSARSLADLVGDLDAGKVEDLFVLSCNPAYDSPPALGFVEAVAKAKFSVHFGGYFDETAAQCQWHLPATHGLEGWSDLEAPDGTASLVQPLIAPLYDTRSLHELIDVLDGGIGSGYALVRETWSARAAPGEFETWWRRALNDGVIAGTAAEKLSGLSPALPKLKPPAAATPLALVLRPDPCVYDGSFANNAWLQELPKPLTKEVWGNSIGVSAADAAALGVRDGDIVNLSAGGGAVAAPVRVAAGHARGVLSLYLGHGRTAAGHIGTGVGANAYRLRADPSWLVEGVVAAPSGEHRPLPSTQHQFRLDGEAAELFPSYALDQFHSLASEKKVALASFFPEEPRSGARWGMVIDTSLCIGCNACVVACQVENNSPIVGPDEIARGRDMHWLRIDAYEIGPPESPQIGFQPVPCMHCETAPCEPVCPTAASVHDHEGLNVQVYNRCIGTRFCEANCPYKVRRFNYFGYADGQEYADLGVDLVRAHNNPDVTVRSRGVMEKCTYCVQRISRARRAADKEDRPIADGEVVTACQAACPTRAISFGDLSLSEAKVSIQRQEPHHYSLLGHLNTRPRTTYLAQVRDFNPNLAGRRG